MTNVKSISMIALTAALSTSLLLSGCGNKDKPGKAAKGAAGLEQVVKRTVSEAEAEQALSASCLSESGAGLLAWGGKQGSAGTYTFSDLTITGDDAPFKMGSLDFVGAHMEGDLAAFDKIVMSNLSVDEEPKVNLASISLVNPSPALANAIMMTLCGDDNAMEDISGDVSFGGFTLNGLDVSSKELNMSLTSLEFGRQSDKKGMFSMQDLKANFIDGDDNGVVTIGSIVADGVNIEKYSGLFTEAFKSGMDGSEMSTEVMAALSGAMNAYDPDFSHMSMKDVNMNFMGAVFKFDSYVADMKKKGKKIIATQALSPMTISFPEGVSDFAEAHEALQMMGYDELVITMGGKTILDEAADTMQTEGSYIALKDGFKLSFDMEMSGYKAFMEEYQAFQMATTSGSMKDADPMSFLGAMNFSDLTISFRDDSIIDRSFGFAAKTQGGTADELKGQAKMGLAFLPMMAQDEAQQKLAGDASVALGTLLDKGGTLVISMHPGSDFKIMDFVQKASGGDIDIEALGVTIETK